MNFIDAISVLSKSSSYAVSTENDLDAELSSIKSDLYVVMPIEEHLFELLNSVTEDSKKVIFLCGSSGDGKSELLLRAREKFSQTYIKFHLDATHSFAPHDSAVDTLNKLFYEYEVGNHSLVIAINIGMLGNYAAEAKNKEIGSILKKYLEEKQASDGYEFLSFEDYPKFEITKDGYNAEFVTKILKKITNPESLLFKVYSESKDTGLKSLEKRIFINYHLLCFDEIQQVITNLLLKVRLFRNQFITSRTFLDFIYELVVGDGYLFDNIFSSKNNEILEKLKEFDPVFLKTKLIDRFLISYQLKEINKDFENFKKEIFEKFNIDDLDNANSYIRLFYLLKFYNLTHGFHNNFEADFSEKLLNDFIEIYRCHKFLKDDNILIKKLRDYYNNDLVTSLRNYINRKSPYLGADQYLIREYGDCQVIANLKFSADLNMLKENVSSISGASFYVFLKVKDCGEIDFPVDINLFELLMKLKSGYRPNKNDRSVVILLNEIISRILALGNKTKELTFKNIQKEFIEEMTFTFEDDYIEVSK
ncbi:DNA phosphorothioation-dependent restriction protein DptF [Acinetobacter baumannii]|uniref:DNA phosphorothioation-dependent restriction protein DptF n=1 Tax=Acinetobacter baumannii TaxID=470 RepID=UPI0014640211|nr:DNA phosphorothioation-dependent restriction protein DptF [Acinetobacter baumannii]MCG5961075.1 DNA phosphorothioation-dependent restriction protein DptF [Acinetobacter baumannii]QJP36176.1 DNA phosphorothioation-dependent restriction protein DptF [Acinetobacter baumannii]